MKPYLIILYFIACITIGATSDALFNIGFKVYGNLTGYQSKRYYNG